MQNLSLPYLIRYPKVPTKNPPLLLMLHGYGSNEKDLFSFANELPDKLLIISLRAPQELGFESYSWYTINFNATSGNFSNLKEAKVALKKISNVIIELKEKFEFNQNNISLFGFSQGTILSYALALNNPSIFKNIIALSGYINQDLIDANNDENYAHLDFFISHGTVDQVIPFIWAKKTSEFLSNLNIKHSFHSYPIGHGVSPQVFYDCKAWIENRI